MTRQILSLLPPETLSAAKRTLQSILVIRPFHQVWDHPWTLVPWLIQPVVSSRWDYCDIPFGLLPSVWKNWYLVSQLQRCQNNVGRIVSLWRKYDPITPILKRLHWLPIEQRINHKILSLAYKARRAIAPPYLSSLLSTYTARKPLRSEGKHLLTTPRRKVLASVSLCILPLPSGTRFLSPSIVLSPLTLSRAVWTHICLIWHSIMPLDILAYYVRFVTCQLVSGVCLIS